jgi:c-di-GMP-binding flagellar brake protein YcgR
VTRPGDAAYTLHARVVVIKEDPDRLIGLRVIGSNRSQQREYFRVPVSITTDEATLTTTDGSRFPVTLHLRDLSATGMRAHCDAPVSVGGQIRMRLTLTGQRQPMELLATVVRANERPGPAGTYWEIGAAFTNLAPTIRERIVHFALSVQLEQRRRGKL